MLIGRADHRPQAPALRTRSDAAHAHNAHCARLMCSAAARAGHAHPDQRQQQQRHAAQAPCSVCTAPGGGAVPSPVGPSPEGTPPARLVAPSPRSFLGRGTMCQNVAQQMCQNGTTDVPKWHNRCAKMAQRSIYRTITDTSQRGARSAPTKCTKAIFCAVKGEKHTCTSMQRREKKRLTYLHKRGRIRRGSTSANVPPRRGTG